MLWSTFKPACLDIDGELDMECLDSGMVLLDPSTPLRSAQDDKSNAFHDNPGDSQGGWLQDLLEQAYGEQIVDAVLLLKD